MNIKKLSRNYDFPTVGSGIFVINTTIKLKEKNTKLQLPTHIYSLSIYISIAILNLIMTNQKVDKKTKTPACSQLSVPCSLKAVRFLYTNILEDLLYIN